MADPGNGGPESLGLELVFVAPSQKHFVRIVADGMVPARHCGGPPFRGSGLGLG